MATLFYADYGTGSLKDRTSATLPTNSGVLLRRTEKGIAARFGSPDDLDGYGIVSGVKTIALVIRPTADTKLLQDDWADVLEITGGSYSGAGLTATYVNNAASAVALLDVWQLVICEFPGGVSFATDLEIDVTASVDIASVWMFGAVSADKRTELYQEFLRRVHISKPIITNALTPVAQFDGYTNVITIPALSIAGHDWRFEALIYPKDFASWNIIIGHSSATRHWAVTLGLKLATGEIQTWIDNTESIISDNAVPLNKWSKIAINYDNTTKAVTFFLNDSEDGGGIAVNTPFTIIKSRIGGTGYQSLPVPTSMFTGTISYAKVWIDGALQASYSLDEPHGTIAYDSVGSNNGTYTGNQPHGQSRKGMIVSWQADDQLRADGRTVSSGDLDGLVVASGSYEALENSSGKYIECATNGTLQIRGVDLSSFVGNGYIKRLGGSLSAEAGQTVDDATNIAFADNTLTITLTAGQTFTGIVITPQA